LWRFFWEGCIKLIKKFKNIFQRLIHLNNSPPEIALGVAVGAFICIIPLYGFHTIMVIIFALLIPKANKIAILCVFS